LAVVNYHDPSSSAERTSVSWHQIIASQGLIKSKIAVGYEQSTGFLEDSPSHGGTASTSRNETNRLAYIATAIATNNLDDSIGVVYGTAIAEPICSRSIFGGGSIVGDATPK
jgi:hypothetical protein